MLDHLNTLVTNQRAAQAELDDCWTATITQAIQTNDLNMLKQLLGMALTESHQFHPFLLAAVKLQEKGL